MNRRQLTERRLGALFLLGVLLLNFPLLNLSSRAQLVAGVPLLFVYLFVVWFVLILAMALVIGPRR